MTQAEWCLVGVSVAAVIACGVVLWFNGVIFNKNEQFSNMKRLYKESERKRRAEQTARSSHEPT